MAIRHDTRLSSPLDCSSGRQFTSFEDIPLDVAHVIADHSSVVDLVALSFASKTTRDLLSDPGIWRKLYKRNPLFLLPPGPYYWQSTSYLANALVRAEKFYSLWPSSSSCPEILRIRTISVGYDAALSVLFGRWLLVAEGPTVVCYDSQCSNIHDSAETLFNESTGRHIFRVFSVGNVREAGVLAFAVLLFEDSYIIAQALMDGGKPSLIQTVLTSTPIPVQGWRDLVHVRLYDRFLVMNICECWNDWDSSEHIVVLDIDTMRRYHVPPSAPEMRFHPMLTVTSFFVTKTHLVKVRECSLRSRVRFKMECFPLPAPHEALDETLNLSHQTRVLHGPKLRECVVINESSADSVTGRKSFALCGLNAFSNGNRLEIMEVSLEPDGTILTGASAFDQARVKSLSIGAIGQHASGIALGMDDKPLVFALDYHGPGSLSFKYSRLDRPFPESELLASNAFQGTVFFSRRSSQHTSIEIVDFVRDAGRADACPPECLLDSELRMKCDCGDCYIGGR